jgi:membrane protease YdiL (CAAX protease family)
MTSPDFLPPRPELPDGMAPMPPAPPEPPPEPPTIALWVPFAVMGIVFIAIGTLSAAVLGIAHAMDPSIAIDDPPQSLVLVLTLIQDAALVLAAVLAFKASFGRVRPADLGLRKVTSWRTAILGIVAAFLVFVLVGRLLDLIFGHQPDQQLVKDLKAEDSFGILAGYMVLTCLVAPVCEELFFRGFVFMTFARRLGPVWGALIAGAIFGLVHAPNPIVALVTLGVLGVALCALYWTTQSIIPCMALHALNNSISFGLTKSLDAGAFLAVVIGSVGLVVAVATAVSSRPAVTA